MLQKSDIVLNSISNSGKTTAFAISVLQLIDRTSPTFQALIMTPNRRIGLILHKLLQDLSSDIGITIEPCFGGIAWDDQIKKFQQGKHQIVVGTPGRIEDIVSQGYLDTNNLKILVLDESHEIIGLGMEEQIKSIIQRLPTNMQKMIITSTIPPELHKIIDSYMKERVELFINDVAFFTGKIEQYYISIEKEEWKLDVIEQIYDNISKL